MVNTSRTETFAAVDIGSNSCRLKIARPVNGRLKTIHEDREVTRLGGSVFETGLVSPDAMATTLRALKRFQRAAQAHGVDHIRVVATAAMRDARNAQAFVGWVKAETGWTVEVISGLEEARLIHRGVMAFEPDAAGKCVLIDVGGGSCEISLSVQKKMKETISLPLGAVRLTQEFLHSDPPKASDVHQMRKFIARELRRAMRRVPAQGVPLVIATSGTAAALEEASHEVEKVAAKKSRNTKKAVRRKTPGQTSTKLVRSLADNLSKLSSAQRAVIPGIGPKRSEIILAGAYVYSDLFSAYGFENFRYSKLGLRDGILAQLYAERHARTSVAQEVGRERIESVLATCKRYGVDPRQAESVRDNVARLFKALEPAHKLPHEYLGWLEAAALMRDIGKFLNYQGHHRHTQYILANTELAGFTRQQMMIISAIARYLGKSRPQPVDRAMRYLPVEEHDHVRHAVVLLRMAVALNQDRASDIVRTSIHVFPKRVTIELHAGRSGGELELWSLRKEAVYFREIFRRELFVTLV